MTNAPITSQHLQNILSRYLAMYRTKTPCYQATMLNSLGAVWKQHHKRVLDVGGGTGVMAQAMAELFPIDEVVSVDLVDRFCASLTIQTQQYDGATLPFADGTFSAATLNNVLHHVPLAARSGLLREIARVVDGPLYIKDHESVGKLDNARLTLMDAIGNIPFGGMLWARYLSRREWETLASESGYRIIARAVPLQYRRGIYALIFPNRLEITMRLEKVSP
ncbi:class I SAM-dependent methyltransferase [Kluyvera sp. 142486]|uniref:class I SAM-dependent methyltransferase n=1 Tax=Kluyvera sp. 142486 TaxID=3390050 RepID=UPI00397FAB74